jgi:subtilisin family serine protease
MRLSIGLLIASVLALTGGMAASHSQSIERQSVATGIPAGTGWTQFIVGVETPFVPEGWLADASAQLEQRGRVRQAVVEVMEHASLAGIDVGAAFDYIPFFVVRTDESALKVLEQLPGIRSIERVQIHRPALAESVPLIGAPSAWASGDTGIGWTVAVLDSGVDKVHPFLAGKVWAEACFSSADGTVFGSGLSVCPGGVPASTAPGSGVPCAVSVASGAGCDHGTHVAGIAVGDGGGSLRGVAPGSGLISIQVFTQLFGDDLGVCEAEPCLVASDVDIIAGLSHVFTLAGPQNQNRIAAVNISIVGPSFGSHCDSLRPAVKAAIDNLRSIGIATVISAGNGGNPSGVAWPACVSSAVSVGATTKQDQISGFSDRAGFLTLVAPGSSITSSVPGGRFGAKSGTSMASPHVSGAIAILKQARPAADVSLIVEALQTTGVPIRDGTLIHRRIRVDEAHRWLLGAPPPPPNGPPGAPGAPIVQGSGNVVHLEWAPAASSAGSTDYTVLARTSAGGPVVAAIPAGSVPSTTVTAPAGHYLVSVRASNPIGIGPESPVAVVSVPIDSPPPGPPSSLLVATSDNRATFIWLPPEAGGWVTGYELIARMASGGPPIARLPAAGSGLTVMNIPAGSYSVSVVARNSAGTGPPSNIVDVSIVPPGVPRLGEATVTGSNVSLSWEPAATGVPPTHFVVTASYSAGGPVIASFSRAAPQTTAVVTNVPTGTYFVRVRAVNGAGPSAMSNEITVTVP